MSIFFLVYLRSNLDVLRRRIAKRGCPGERNMDPQFLINVRSPYGEGIYDKSTTYPIPSNIFVLGGTMSVEELTAGMRSRLPNIKEKRFLFGPLYLDMSKLT